MIFPLNCILKHWEVSLQPKVLMFSDTNFKQTIMDLNAGSTDQYWFRCWKVNVKAVTGGIIELSGKALNQDVVIMTGGI
jgi:hypothetical protein